MLDRIDRHIDRGTELMARMVELHEDQRQFMRDLTRRNEIVIQGMVRQIRDLQRETTAGRQILVDLHEESVAQRSAIWTLIDELRTHGLGGRG